MFISDSEPSVAVLAQNLDTFQLPAFLFAKEKVSMVGLNSILERRPPTAWNHFISSPLLFLARWAYGHSQDYVDFVAPVVAPETARNPIRVVCISDTHNTHHVQPPLPEGDILVHAGDLTQSGTVEELDDALAWLAAQPHPHKILIAGNHDAAFTSPHIRERVPEGLTYLEDTATELCVRGRTLRVYGSPHTPKQGSWPFQYQRVHPAASSFSPSSSPGGERASEVWSRIPPATDILVTHGPPLGHLDVDKYGCYALLSALWRVRPRLHVFGHIHGGRGVECVRWDSAQKAYEDICAGRARWGGLLRLLWCRMLARIYRPPRGHATVLVNAAAVDGRGIRDDQRRGAIVVEI